MYISKFKILNYKSFLTSSLIEFKSGINIIVGQNNSGKTSLLECLTLRFENLPHRSIKPFSERTLDIGEESLLEVSICLEKEKFLKFMPEIKKALFISPREAVMTDDFAPHPKDKKQTLIKEWIEKFEFLEIDLKIKNDDIFIEKERHLNFVSLGSFVKGIKEGENPLNFDPQKLPSIRKEVFQSYPLREIQNHIYRFYAERPNRGTCPVGNNAVLEPDASNLAEVLNVMQGQNPGCFKQLNQYISAIFPDVKWISVRLRDNSTLEVLVWFIEPENAIQDELAFPLSSCGTGIGQVLAILTVVLMMQGSRIIIIDEPQSFLHPGAAKKLMEILQRFPKHQYFISTHSPAIISAANPSTVVMLHCSNLETSTETIDSKDLNQLYQVLKGLGIKLSDVFGADNILWVEGETEEKCFQLILENEKPKAQFFKGTEIIAVKATGDFEGKRTRLIFDIYEKLSGGNNLFPPAIGFVFDRETRSKKELDDLRKMAKGKVFFLKRRMYENYLLHPEAIAAVINDQDSSRDKPLASIDVQHWIENNRQNEKYLQKNDNSVAEWFCTINGAKILEDCFAEFSEKRLEFRKTVHSIQITQWLLDNQPEELAEVSELLLNVLAG